MTAKTIKASMTSKQVLGKTLAFLKKWWLYIVLGLVLGFLLGYINGIVSSIVI